jgi:excisionase family DNA binding protein
MKLLLTVEETAEMIGLGRTMTYELLNRGLLESVRLGKARRVPMAAVEEFVDRLRAEEAVHHGDGGAHRVGVAVPSATPRPPMCRVETANRTARSP